jgi:hypothetical protein
MDTTKKDDFAQALERLMRIWDRMALAVAEMHPDLSEEEREKLTREGMDLVLKGLTSPRVH